MKKTLYLITIFSILLFASCRGAKADKDVDEEEFIEEVFDEKDNAPIVDLEPEPEGETYDPEAKSSKKLNGKVYVAKYEAFANEVISKLEKTSNMDSKVAKELEMDVLRFRAKNELNMDSITLEEMRKLGEIHIKLEEALNKVDQR